MFAPVARTFAAGAHGAKVDGDVVIPELVDTLEWVLDSPPTVHQFDEPPVSYSGSCSSNTVADWGPAVR